MFSYPVKIDLPKCRSRDILIGQLTRLLRIPPGDKVRLTIDLRGFLEPDYLALIVCACKHALSKGVEINYHPIHDNTTPSYASRINFFSNLEIPFEEGFLRHDAEERLIEITNFDSQNVFGIPDKLSAILIAQTYIDHSIITLLDHCLGEVVDNVINHSQCTTGGWAVAQYFPTMNRIKVVVADAGIGIHRALTSKVDYENWSEPKAIMKCIEKGVTSDGMGNGLYITSEFIKKNQGQMILQSGQHHVCIDRRGVNGGTGNFWKGTYVYLEIRTNVLVEENSFIEEFAHLGSTFEVFREKFGLDEDTLW